MGTSILLWWLGGVVAIALGSLGVFWGLWGRRLAQGDRPRCPRCRYDMTGVVGLTCPECGRAARDAWALTHSPRRWSVAVLGLALLVGGACLPVAGVVVHGFYSILPYRARVTLWEVKPAVFLGRWIMHELHRGADPLEKRRVATVAAGLLEGFADDPAVAGAPRHTPGVESVLEVLGALGDDAVPAADAVAKYLGATPPRLRGEFADGLRKSLGPLNRANPAIGRLLASSLSDQDIAHYARTLTEGEIDLSSRITPLLASGDPAQIERGLRLIKDDEQGLLSAAYPGIIALVVEGPPDHPLRRLAVDTLSELGPGAETLIGGALMVAPYEATEDLLRALTSRRKPSGDALPFLRKYIESPAKPIDLRDRAVGIFDGIAWQSRVKTERPTLPWYAPVWPPAYYAPPPGEPSR